MKLSIVTALYRSAPELAEFHRRASNAARALVGDDFEIILVNDGSPDDSLNIACGLTHRDSRLSVIDLSRNFGQHKALMTGLAHARGERVFMLDADLEEEPEWLLRFDEAMRAHVADAAYGVQSQRRGSLFDRVSGETFYRLFRLMTGLAVPINVTTARLMSRRYVDALLRHQEREVFMAGLWHLTGFAQTPVEVNKLSLSPSSYNIRKKFSMLVTSVTSFSSAPLVGIFYIGMIIFIAALIFTSYLIFNWLFINRPPPGWTSVMASVWLLGGMIIAFVGVIGVYLHKVFIETKARPYTIVRAVHHGAADGE